MQVDPNGTVLRLTDPRLFDYPFIYMSNVQSMTLSVREATALRQYLLNGGFLMADDFWAAAAWRHVRREMTRVFPKSQTTRTRPFARDFQYRLPNRQDSSSAKYIAWSDGHMIEPWHGSFEGDEAPHFQGYFDDEGRLMAVFCHNNDVGDGWEREGQNREFFETFSMKMSYPLGINIVTYAMTH